MSEEEQIDDQLKERGKRGHTSSASVENHDSRVSRGIAIFMGCLGVAAVGVVGWVAVSINELNVNVARLVTKMEAQDLRDNTQDTRISRTEDRLESVTGAVRTLEGKNLRGLPDEP